MAYKPWKLPSTTYPSLSSFLFVIWNVPQGFPCLNTWSPMVALFEKVTGGEQWRFYRSPDPLPIHSLLLEHKHVINLLLAPATMLFLPQYPSGTIYKSCLPEVASVRIFFGGSRGSQSLLVKEKHYLSSLLGCHHRHENHPSEKLVRIFNMAIGKELRQYLLTPNVSNSFIYLFNHLSPHLA